MAGVGAAVTEALQRGIREVVSEEFPLQARQKQANDLYSVGESLMAESRVLTQTQRIVNNAANAAKRNFQASGLKQEIKAKFEQLLTNGIESITADHGHTEDDELLALVMNLTTTKNHSMDEVANLFNKYYQQYTKAVQDQAAEGIDQNRRADIENRILLFMREGYSFLASLGEEIRQTPIVYEVTVAFGDGLHKTGHFTLEELMENTRIEMHRGTFQLRLNNVSALSHMAQWSSELNNSYNQWKASEKISSQKWNEGEKMERFREEATYIFNEELERALGMSPEQIAGMDPHGRHYFIHSSLNLSYTKGPDFFANIDRIFDNLIYDNEAELARDQILMQASSINVNGMSYVAIQEKAEGATFTNLGGLLRSLSQASQNLNQLAGALNVAGKIQDMNDIDQAVEDAAVKLVQQFLAI